MIDRSTIYATIIHKVLPEGELKMGQSKRNYPDKWLLVGEYFDKLTTSGGRAEVPYDSEADAREGAIAMHNGGGITFHTIYILPPVDHASLRVIAIL